MHELEISDPASETSARVAPSRGGMVTALAVAARPVFFLDRATLLDRSKNVRGGSPVLFPTPGKLAGDRWSRDGKSGSLAQHGFARNLPWTVIDTCTDAITLCLESSDATRLEYPWDFRVDLVHRAHTRSLSTTARIENRGPTPMPFGFGFHPYFAVEDKSTFALDSGATRALDNVTKREISFDARSLDFGAELDLHLLDHGGSQIAFAYDDVRVVISGSPEYTHWVLWSLPGRPFVCVEPWTCPGDAMNTGDRLLHLAPGEAVELALEHRVEVR